MDNELFLTKSPGTTIGVLAVGSYGRKSRVYLSEDEAMKLAYRLMSLGSGGETRGIEQFERNA